MKYIPLLLLVFLTGSFAQPPIERSPRDVNLPNGQKWSDVIAGADHKRNLEDARTLAVLAAEIRDEIENGDKFVLSLKTLRKVEDAEKLAKELRSRMRKN